MTYSITRYRLELYNDEENGQPTGSMIEHMKILSKYVDFVPSLHVAKTFVEGYEMVESSTAKIGSPGAASFL